MSILYIIIVCLLGLAWGVCEGMTMIQYKDINYRQYLTRFEDGIRSHEWYKYYHALDMLTIILAVILGYVFSALTCKDCFIVGGAIFLGWELKELGYGFARWNRPDETEHFDFMDIISIELSKKQTTWSHITKVAIGSGLIIKGFMP